VRWYQLIGLVLLAWFLVALAVTPFVAAFIRLGKRRQLLHERWSEGEQPAGRREARVRARGPATVG
jgi:hypothetical protein